MAMNDAGGAPVAIVTGAGSGIGLATARLLRERGWRVALAGRREEPLRAASAELGGDGAALPIAADVSRGADAGRIAAETERAFGRIDALVNNAGHAAVVPIERTDEALLREVYGINTFGTALMIAAVWPVFTRRRAGCVVNISSMASADPFPGFFAYAGAKAATNLMARSCALEGKAAGIRGFAVAPGAVETAMLRSMFDQKRVPPAACLSPEDVARIVVACIAGERDADNGRTIFLSRGPGGVTERVA